MSTVLDSFVLEFGLDHRQFSRSQQEVLDELRKFEDSAVRGGKGIEAQTKKVYDLLGNFRREALTTLALFFGGKEIGQFVDHITKLDAATGRLAKTLGMSAEETSAWQGAIRQAGGSTEGANAALAGLSGEMNRFQLTGQSTMLPVLSRLGISLYDQNRNLKTAGQLWLELSDAISGMDPRQAQAFLQMIPGANQDMINFALLGRRAMEQYLEAQRTVGVTTAQSAEAAQRYQRALTQLEDSSTNLGRSLVTVLAPALSTVANSLANLFSSWSGSSTPSTGASSRSALIQRFGSPRALMEWLGEHSPIPGDKEYTEGLANRWYGPKGSDEKEAAKAELARRMRASISSGSAAGSTNEVETYIRQAAAARGIDPEVAITVAKSEGLYNYVGDQGTSFGPYQLHYGGGLGDKFTAQTGKNARDPSTWKSQVDFSLDQAKAGGWGPWHGWHGAPFAGIGGGGTGGARSTTINVGGVTVNTTSGNGDGIARDIDGALKRSLTAGSANTGPQ